ncbi:MAG: glycosyl hydrolase family 28-related protein, partial [Planctomycetota bacterium]
MSHLFKTIFCSAVLMLLTAAGARADGTPVGVELPRQFISVADYKGNANQRIKAAMADAAKTKHKTVFFPNGTYALRDAVSLNLGPRTEIHLIGESRDGVQLIPDIPYLEANFRGGKGERLIGMINLDSHSVFNYVNVSIQNMTLNMKSQAVHLKPRTYNVIGHGVRVGQGWRRGKFKVNHVTIKNIGGYGIGVQDRGGHPKSNITLTNLHIERTGSDGIDTKEASGNGNRNLIIRDVTVKDIGYTDGGYASALDIRYRDVIIERVNLSSAAKVKTPTGKTTNNGGITFRPNGGVLRAKVSEVYINGFSSAISVQSTDGIAHRNIAISDFKIEGYSNSGIRIWGPKNTGHRVSDGYVHSKRGKALIYDQKDVTVRNVTKGPWPDEK